MGVAFLSLKKYVSYCQISDSFEAGESLFEGIQKKNGGAVPDILFLFCTAEHEYEKLIEGIFSKAGRRIKLCGCTGTGVISSLGSDEAIHSAALMAIHSEDVKFKPFIFSDMSSNYEEIGVKIAAEFKAVGTDEKAEKIIMLLPDGHNFRTSRILEIIDETLGHHAVCVGGNASNDIAEESTFQFMDGDIKKGGICGVIIYGNFNYKIKVSHGSKAVGRFMTVTRSADNVVYELDGQPALDMLARLAGKKALSDFGMWSSFNAFSETFGDRGYPEDVVIKALLDVDDTKKSLMLTTTIAEGTRVRMAFRDKERVIDRTRKMASEIVSELKDPDSAAYFYFNCVARGSYLFGDTNPDIDSLFSGLGNKDVIGFFTFGEIAPVAGKNFFHNHTGVLLAIE